MLRTTVEDEDGLPVTREEVFSQTGDQPGMQAVVVDMDTMVMTLEEDDLQYSLPTGQVISRTPSPESQLAWETDMMS